MVTNSAKISSISSPSEQLSMQLEGCHVEQIRPLQFGIPGSLHYRAIFLNKDLKELVSPWHDISLYRPDGLISCVCKTPAGSWVRYETAGDEPFNPLRVVRTKAGLRARQGSEFAASYSPMAAKSAVKRRGSSATYDEPRSPFGSNRVGIPVESEGQTREDKVGKLATGCKARYGGVGSIVRPSHYVDNVPWNLGMLPQTWAASGRPPRGYCPLEVVEIGADKIRAQGEVYAVKPLGAYSVDDGGGVLTWKIVAIAADDAMAPLLQDAGDVHLWLPGMLETIREWLRTCLCTQPGDKESLFQLNSRPANFSVTQTKIAEFHEAWGLFPGRHLVHPKAAMLDPQRPLTAADLEKAWAMFTAKEAAEHKAGVNAIPSSCPTPQSSMMFDPNWLRNSGKGFSPAALVSQSSEPATMGRSRSVKFGGTLRRARKSFFGFLSGQSVKESQKQAQAAAATCPPPTPSQEGGRREERRKRTESKKSPGKEEWRALRKSAEETKTKAAHVAEQKERTPGASPKLGPATSSSSQSELSVTPKNQSGILTSSSQWEFSMTPTKGSATFTVGSQSAASSAEQPAADFAGHLGRSPWAQMHQSEASAKGSPKEPIRAGEEQQELIEEESGEDESDNEEMPGVTRRRNSVTRRIRRKGRPRGRSLELSRKSETEKVFSEVKVALAKAIHRPASVHHHRHEMRVEGSGGVLKLSWEEPDGEEDEEEKSELSSDENDGELVGATARKTSLRRSISLQEFKAEWGGAPEEVCS